MSVQVVTTKRKNQNLNPEYVLVFTDPLGITSLPSTTPNGSGLTVVLKVKDAQELHDLLGKELICTDCPCYDYGVGQGIECGRSQM